MLSRSAYIICVALLLYVALIFDPKWKNTGRESSLGWDVSTYYWYLPATFIYHDLKEQKFGDSIIDKYGFTPVFEQSFVHESGNRVITYSSGLAVVFLPAFAVAHALAAPLGYEADGFSLPYQAAVHFWSLLAAIVGLWYFRKLLLRYFSDKVTAISLVLLVFGTNYLNYTGVDVTLTHSWLFTIYTLVLLNTGNFYADPRYKYAIRIGLLTGLAILIRPSDMIIALIPLLWGMESISPGAIKRQVKFFIQNYRPVLLAVLCTILVGSIQIIYWLYVAGEPLVYSYDDKGFYWTKPHFFDYTFSYRSGWLVYTPLMFFAFVGLLVYLWKGKNKVAIISFFLLNYYIIAAWDVWWYGGMGGRPMVQSYAITFFMIAALVDVLLKTRWIKWPVFAIMAVFVYVNIWFTYNAHTPKGLYDPVGMTKAYYWKVVGRFKVPEYTVRFKDTDEYFEGAPKNMKQLYSYGFEDDTTASDIYPISGKRSLYFHPYREYSPILAFPYLPGNADWLRAKVTIKVMDDEWEYWKMLQFTIGFVNKEERIKTNMIRLHRFAIEGKPTEVYFDVKIPKQPFDSVQVYFWNPGSYTTSKLDDIEVWSFEE